MVLHFSLVIKEMHENKADRSKSQSGVFFFVILMQTDEHIFLLSFRSCCCE